MDTTTEKRKPSPKPKVRLIIHRNYSGDRTVEDAFIPVIVEDLRRKSSKIRTIDFEGKQL